MQKENPRKILDKKYILKRRIGYGGQGEVFLVENIDDHKEYAAKMINEEKCSEYEKGYFRNEIEILNLLSNEEKKYVPHLYDNGEGYVKYEGENENENKKRDYLIINYAKNGDLFYYLKMASEGFKEIHAKLIFKKILEGIQYCHKKNICHLDIKIENILLDEEYDPLITDFGLSSYISDKNGLEIPQINRVGTPNYMCPQMIKKEHYFGIDADIFSLGVVLFKLVTGKFGFGIASQNDKLYQYIMGKHSKTYWDKISYNIQNASNLSEEFKALFISMVSYNQKNRPRIDQILKGDWLKEINDMDEDKLNELNSEVIAMFMSLEDKIGKQNEIIQKKEETGTDNTFNQTRGSSEEEGPFGDHIKIKKIKFGEKFANHYMKIKGDLNPNKFMNSLIKKIKDKYDDYEFEFSKSKLKFSILFEREQENDENIDFEELDNTCIIKIKMYEDEEGGYLVNFIKLQGDLEDYYTIFLNIKQIIKELLN